MKEFRKQQIRLTLLTSIVYFSYYMARYNYGISLPFIQKEFALSNTQLGMFATTLTLMYAIGQFINGYLIDKYGPRLMMMIGAIMSTVSNFGVFLSNSFSMALTAWGLNGYFQAFGYGSCCKLYANWFPPEERGKALGFNEALQSFSSAVIAPIGAFIIVRWGWRYVYFLPVLPKLLLGVAFYFLEKNHPPEGRPEPAPVSLQDVLYSYKQALGDWKMLACYASYGGSQFARFAVYTWVPLYVFTTTGLDIMQSSIVVASFALGGALGSFVIGWATDIMKKRYPLIVAGMILSAVALLIFSNPNIVGIGMLSLLMALCGFGIEAVEVAYFLLPMDILDEENLQATGVGCMNAWGKTFATFQGVMFGALVDAAGFAPAFQVTAVIAFAAAVLVVPIRK